MKKLYFLVSAILISLTSSAQSDLAILHNIGNGDTIKINQTNPVQYALAFGFVNYGPNALTQTDTIYLKTPYTSGGYFTLTLPVGGVPVNDTVYFLDTVGFGTGPATGPGQWCDSIWAKNSSNMIIADPVISNNKLCTPIYFLNQTLSISENLGNSKNAVITRLDIYPNPAVNSIGFEYNAPTGGNAFVSVSDVTGRKVYQKDLGNVYGAQKVTIDANSFTNGIYIVELVVDNAKHVGKFVIQK